MLREGHILKEAMGEGTRDSGGANTQRVKDGLASNQSTAPGPWGTGSDLLLSF